MIRRSTVRSPPSPAPARRRPQQPRPRARQTVAAAIAPTAHTVPRATAIRRQPQQRRARQTVEAVLDAVIVLLKRDGIAGVTTNRIAEMAGISVGSLYQYFPDKHAIFAALHDRHAAEIAALVERTLVDHAASPLDNLVRALVEALVDAHGADPELHELLSSEIPHGGGGARSLQDRLRNAFRLALAARGIAQRSPAEAERILFVVPILVESLAHGVAHARPPRLSLAAARREAVRAVLAYLAA